jgi:pectinesterase
MLGTTAHLRELEGDGGHAKFSSAVQVVAAFNPVLDLVTPAQNAGNAAGPIQRFLGGPYEKMAEVYAQASPITHAGKRSAPHLFLHGTADALVPYQQSVDMQKKLAEAGVRAELYPAEGAQHGFFNRPPYFQPTLERMEQFFRSVLLR